MRIPSHLPSRSAQTQSAVLYSGVSDTGLYVSKGVTWVSKCCPAVMSGQSWFFKGGDSPPTTVNLGTHHTSLAFFLGNRGPIQWVSEENPSISNRVFSRGCHDMSGRFLTALERGPSLSSVSLYERASPFSSPFLLHLPSNEVIKAWK